MADTEAIPDATQEIANPAEDKTEENNNSEEMSPAAENPGSDPVPSDEGRTNEDQPATEQNADTSEEPAPENVSQGAGTGDEAQEPAGEITENASDAPPQEATKEEDAVKEDDQDKSQEDSRKPNGDEVTAENTEKEREDTMGEETPQENQAAENPSSEKAEEEAAEQSNEPDEADAPPKGEDTQGGAEASAETEDKVPGEMEVINTAEADTPAEQQEGNTNSNENDEQEDTPAPDGERNEDHEQEPSSEPAEVTSAYQNEEITPETDQATTGDPPADVDKSSTPVPEEPPKETADDVEVPAITDVEPAEEEGLTDYEVKYRAAQKDIQELRALNAEIQQRLAKSEEEASERKRQEGKESMSVQADYLARELSQQQNTEKYLREKLAEVLEEKEESERKCKDLQLRLKRFVKDDQAKDERMAKLESELREISQEVQMLEEHLDQETLTKIRASKGLRETNGQATAARPQKSQTPVPQSKTCVIL